MQVTGIIKHIGDLHKVSDKFQKQEVVLTIEPISPYPQHVQFECKQDKCNLLSPLNVGDDVTIDFNLNGREWNGEQGIKYFNTLDVWRIKTNNQADQKTIPLPSNNIQDLPF